MIRRKRKSTRAGQEEESSESRPDAGAAAEALVQPFEEARDDLQRQADSPIRDPVYASETERIAKDLRVMIASAREELAMLQKQKEVQRAEGRSEAELPGILDQLLAMSDASFVKKRGGEEAAGGSSSRATKRHKGDDEEKEKEKIWNKNAQQHVSALKKVTGLNIQDADIHACKLDDGSIGWTYTLKGDSHGVDFVITFDADTTEKHAVRSLQVKLPGPTYQEMSVFTERVCEERALLSLFRGLLRYTRAMSVREEAFKKLIELFPDHCKIAYDNGRILRCEPAPTPGTPGLPFDIVWRIKVSPDALLAEEVELCPRPRIKKIIGKGKGKEDEKRAQVQDLVDVAPQRFKQLVDERGVIGAVEILIRASFGLGLD